MTPLPGVGDRAYTWALSSLRYAAAQVGDIVLMVVGHDAAAVAQVLRIAVSHL